MAGIGLTIVQVAIGVLVAMAAVIFFTGSFNQDNNEGVSIQLVEEETEKVTKEDFKAKTIEIKTKKGRIQGVEEVIGDSRVFYSFRGIPFAEPPVGELRFKDPVAVRPWSGVKGGKAPPMCPQVNISAYVTTTDVQMAGQEDCLYLNVYTPRAYSSDLPVMVYIHGGGFAFGDADTFGGKPGRLLTKDIVLVSIQYRLGTLGFLSTEDSTLPGNYGMKDQTLALRWVQENIRDFGGDPQRVTIFGHSAGSASVHLHFLSPYSEGLFHQAILQSGTALAPFAVRDDHKKMAVEIEKILECPGAGESLDSTSFLHCLQNAPVSKIALVPMKLITWNLLPFTMLPRVDGDFIPEHPAKLLRDGLYNQVNFIAGITAHESAGTVAAMFSNASLAKDFVKRFDIVGPCSCGVETEESAVQLFKQIFYHYMDEIEVSEDYAEELAEIFSDCFFNIGHDESILLHVRQSSAGANIYAYEFEHRGLYSFMSFYNTSVPDHWVPHGDELQYLFNGIFTVPALEDPADLFFSEIMVQLWTNFAITGNPTPDLSLGFKWHPVTKDAYHYLALKPSPVMKDNKRTQRREFWKNLPTKINKLLYPEHFKEASPTPHQEPGR